MLPKKNRLPLRNKISFLRQNGQIVQNPFFGLLYLLDKQQACPRFAFVVSNKINSKATSRNKIRRLLSEAVYANVKLLDPQLQAVFLTKKTIVGLELVEIKKELVKIFTQTNLYFKNEKTY